MTIYWCHLPAHCLCVVLSNLLLIVLDFYTSECQETEYLILMDYETRLKWKWKTHLIDPPLVTIKKK